MMLLGEARHTSTLRQSGAFSIKISFKISSNIPATRKLEIARRIYLTILEVNCSLT